MSVLLGQFLKQIRQRQKLTLDDLSAELQNASRSYISHIENGRRYPSRDFFESIIIKLNPSFQELCELEEICSKFDETDSLLGCIFKQIENYLKKTTFLGEIQRIDFICSYSPSYDSYVLSFLCNIIKQSIENEKSFFLWISDIKNNRDYWRVFLQSLREKHNVNYQKMNEYFKIIEAPLEFLRMNVLVLEPSQASEGKFLGFIINEKYGNSFSISRIGNKDTEVQHKFLKKIWHEIEMYGGVSNHPVCSLVSIESILEGWFSGSENVGVSEGSKISIYDLADFESALNLTSVHIKSKIIEAPKNQFRDVVINNLKNGIKYIFSSVNFYEGFSAFIDEIPKDIQSNIKVYNLKRCDKNPIIIYQLKDGSKRVLQGIGESSGGFCKYYRLLPQELTEALDTSEAYISGSTI